MEEIVAESELIGVRSSGEKVPLRILIGKPYEASDVDWACPVAVEGLHKYLADQHGVDSFQALALAQKLCRVILEGFVEDGGKILSTDSGLEVNLSELFASDTQLSNQVSPRKAR